MRIARHHLRVPIPRPAQASLALLLAISLFSCSKKDDLINQNAPQALTAVSANSVPTPYFNWSTADFVPGSATNARLAVPWGTTAFHNFSDDIKPDFKNDAGWELLYNTFDDTQDQQSGTRFFILYNKYRGVARVYYHISNRQTYTSSNDLFYGIQTGGPYAKNSPFLNYAGPQIIDISKNLTNSYVVVEKGRTINTDSWYACEFEIAYDRNMASQNYNSFFFDWYLKAIQISQLKAKGTLYGNITGNISMPSSNFSFTGGAVNTNNVETLLNIGGKIDANGNGGANDGLGELLTKAASDGLQSALTNGVSGLITNVFSAITGGDSNQPNTNLKLQADIDLTGSITATGGLTTMRLAPSGYDQSQTTTFIPYYDKPLGVFYLKSGLRFTREHHIVQHTNQPSTDTYFVNLDSQANIDRLDFNPEVLNVATISNYSQELIGIDNGGANANFGGRYEVIGDGPSYDANGNDVGAQPITYHVATMLQADNIAPSIVGIRIGFDVTPKDGKSPKVRITKTFTASLVDSGEVVVTDPPGQDPY